MFVAPPGNCATGTVTYTVPCAVATGITIGATGSLQGTGILLPSLHPASISVPFTIFGVGAVVVITTGTLSGQGSKAITDLVSGETYQDAIGGVAAGTLIPLGIPGPCTPAVPLDVIIDVADVEIA
jgi:hypothetical protein